MDQNFDKDEDINIYNFVNKKDNYNNFLQKFPIIIKNKYIREFKCIKFIIFLTVLFTLQLGKLQLPGNFNSKCNWDCFFEISTPINKAINNNTNLYRSILIPASLLMDIIFITMFWKWLKSTLTLRLPIALLFFYATRGLVQKTFLMNGYKGERWDDTGIPTIVIPYGYTYDFFYSGHLGFATISFLEFKYIKSKMK